MIACAAMAAQASEAEAAGCTYFASTDVFLVQFEGSNSLEIRRRGDELEVFEQIINQGSSEVACAGGPTVDNVDEIVVGAPAGAVRHDLHLRNAHQFEPGVTNETGSSDEIEVSVDLGAGGVDFLHMDSTGPVSMGAGTGGVNANVAEATDDIDVTLTQVEGLVFFGDPSAAETWHANGAGSTGNPFPAFVSMNGRGGADSLIGGAASDTLRVGPEAVFVDGAGGVDDKLAAGSVTRMDVDLAAGFAAFDGNPFALASIENVQGDQMADVLRGNFLSNELTGGSGNDLLEGRTGSDLLEGDQGRDTASFAGSPVGVSVDLGTFGSQDTGQGVDLLEEIEGVTGTSLADVLSGDARANVLKGGAGPDNLKGRAGKDLLNGGPQRDRCRGGAGRNTLRSCER